MDTIWLVVVLAVTVEALVEYGKNIVSHQDSKAVVLQLSAAAVSILLCVLASADVYAFLGVTFGGVPGVGCVLTGIFASRGANYVSDFIGKLRGV